MKDDERQEFERFWKAFCERTAFEGDTEAYLVAEEAWEACWQHAQGAIDRLIESSNRLASQLETWAPHEYRPTCACHNCLAIGEFRGLLKSMNEP